MASVVGRRSSLGLGLGRGEGRRVRARPWGELGSRSRRGRLVVVGVGSRDRRLGLGRRGVACRGLCRPLCFVVGWWFVVGLVVGCVTEALFCEGVGSGSWRGRLGGER
jgi:hypothetical protein